MGGKDLGKCGGGKASSATQDSQSDGWSKNGLMHGSAHVVKLDKTEKSQNIIINRQQLARQIASNRKVTWRKEAAGQVTAGACYLALKSQQLLLMDDGPRQ